VYTPSVLRGALRFLIKHFLLKKRGGGETQKSPSKDTKYEKKKLKYPPRISLNPQNTYYFFRSKHTKEGMSVPSSKSQHSAFQTSTSNQTSQRLCQA